MIADSNVLCSDGQTLSSYADFIAIAIIAMVLGAGAELPVLSFFHDLGLMPQ